MPLGRVSLHVRGSRRRGRFPSAGGDEDRSLSEDPEDIHVRLSMKEGPEHAAAPRTRKQALPTWENQEGAIRSMYQKPENAPCSRVERAQAVLLSHAKMARATPRPHAEMARRSSSVH